MNLNQDEDWVSRVKASALGMRKKAFEQVMKHQGGYFSQVCSSAELLATLYLKILRAIRSGRARISVSVNKATLLYPVTCDV